MGGGFYKVKGKSERVALVNRFLISSVKCWTANFCIHTNKGLVIMMNKLKSIYNSPFKDSHSHPIHTCFPMIASNADLGTTPPATDIWWSSLETCSNWFT